MDQTCAPPSPVTVIITVSNKATSSGGEEEGEDGAKGTGRRHDGLPLAAEAGDDEVEVVRESGFLDLARRSLRARAVRRRLALHRLRRRYHQQQAKMCALAISRQMQQLRRDKEILSNFVRLRLYETQSSFSGSDVASSSGMDRSSDSERLGEHPCKEVVDQPSEEAAVDDDNTSRRLPDSAVASVGDGSGGGAGDPPAGYDDEVRKILRMRRRRRRHLLESCGATVPAAAAGSGGQRVEQYTDKTRNAAVVMGERDIKQSLRMQRRSLAAARGFSLPACAQPESLTALARSHRRAGNPRAGLVLLEQALLLDPMSQRALLERGHCYYLLGQPRLALLDAEDALDLNKRSDAALYLKAQALYAMGHFEKALVVYHRCSRLRSENPEYRAGIQRATEAIMNTISCLPKDFQLSSLERLLSSWPDEEKESSVGSVAVPARPLRPSSASASALPHTGDIVTALQVFGVPGAFEESDLSGAEAEAAGAGAGAGAGAECGDARGLAVCRSCKTVHYLAEDRLTPTTPPNADVEEEARKIALILSLTSSYDNRNKHLRDKLLIGSRSASSVSAVSLSTPVSAAYAGSRSRSRSRSRSGARSRGAGAGAAGLRLAAESQMPERWLPSSASSSGPATGQGQGQGHRRSRKFASSRPGTERVPPSFGRDVEFLEQIAFDPGLRGLPVSGMAEEGVRYLKARQVFWCRRGPIIPQQHQVDTNISKRHSRR